MALAPEEKISYQVAGPKADAAFEAGAAGFQAKGFRGCGICPLPLPPRSPSPRPPPPAFAHSPPPVCAVTSEPFEVSDDQDSVQMCVRAMRRLAARPRAHARPFSSA